MTTQESRKSDGTPRNCVAADETQRRVTSALSYLDAHTNEFVKELSQFLRIPSISTRAEHRPDMRRAAAWLHDRLLDIGMPCVKVIETSGHPVVYSEWCSAGAQAPTVLVYCHYDVQPADPCERWQTPAFEPTQIGDHLFGRGTSDDKGQLYAHIKALEAYGRTASTPPVNVKLLFEGEEEINSPSLRPFIHDNRELLAANIAVVSDMHILSKQQPAIVYGMRGLVYIEVEVTGPATDLHSGVYGGAVLNPLHVLCSIVASLHDPHGRVTIPGFYERVRIPDMGERAHIAQIPFDRNEWLLQAGIGGDWGESEYTIAERTWTRPALDVNGIWGGYIEAGAKTVIPSKATAKMSMRLVPDQSPDEIIHLTKQYLLSLAPPNVTIEVREIQKGGWALVSRDSSAMKAAFGAYAAGFGVEPVFVRDGGTIAAVDMLQTELGIDVVMMGFGLRSDSPHSPNENVYLPNLYRGAKTILHFYELLGK